MSVGEQVVEQIGVLTSDLLVGVRSPPLHLEGSACGSCKIVSVVEPGTVDTELVSHLREDVRRPARTQMESIEPLRPEDIADAVSYIVTRDRRVAVNEILVRAAEQR